MNSQIDPRKSKSCIYFLWVQLVIFSICTSAWGWRIGSPEQNWSSVSTQHFKIIFPEEHRQLAFYYAQIAENQFNELKKTFTDTPELITVIINDSTDSPNGYATVIPYPHIMIYPVPVLEDTSLSESANWAQELFVHELTHILQLYPHRGVYRFLRPIFGSIISPNLLLPTWWKEGMSVEVETQIGFGGRLRSNYQSATTRAFFKDERLQNFTLAQANENLLQWPYAGLPYYLGSYIMGDLTEDRALSSLGYISLRQAERAPFFIEAPIVEISGGSYNSLFQKTMSYLSTIAQDQIGALETTELTKSNPVAPDLRHSRWPRYSPNGEMLALIGTNDMKTQVMILKSEQGSWKPLELKSLPSGDLDSIAWSQDSQILYYTKLDQLRRGRLLSDIYAYDLTEQKSFRLSENKRAKQITISPDNKKIAFIVTVDGQTHVEMAELPSASQFKDWKPKEFKSIRIQSEGFDARITGITFLENSKILINVRSSDATQHQVIKSPSTATATASSETNDWKTIEQRKITRGFRYPTSYKDHIFFVDDSSGVMNVYKTSQSSRASSESTKGVLDSKSKKPEPLTNVLSGVQSFDVDIKQKKVAFTLITSQGYQVHEASWPLVPMELKKIEDPIQARYENSELRQQFQSQIQTSTIALNGEPEEYSPWSFLIPRYWIPFVATSSSQDGFYLQALTSGFDPLQTHSYQAVVNYDTALDRAGYDFLYANHVMPWPVQLTASQSQQIFGTSDSIIERRNASLLVVPDLFKVNPDLTVAIGPQYLATGLNQITTGVPPLTEHVGIGATALYSNVTQKAWHYHPMSGWAGVSRIEWNEAQQDWGPSHPTFTRLTAGANYYWSEKLPEDHVVHLKGNLMYIPEKVAARYGTSNAGVATSADATRPEFLLRGYQSGQFFGTQLATVSTEYRFPLLDVFRGSGSDPFFVRYMTGALVADGLSVRGQGLTENKTFKVLSFGPSFWSAGAEIRMNTTVGYLLPLNFVLGAYVPFSPEFSRSATFGLSLQIGGADFGLD